MSESWKDAVSRRLLLAALGAILGLGVIGGVAYEVPALVRRRFAPSAYDDLLAGLGERDAANRLGVAVLEEAEVFEPARVARQLRHRIDQRPLQTVLASDLEEGRIVETEGWVLPETLALLCGLSAKIN
jgi:hypothetical protein